MYLHSVCVSNVVFFHVVTLTRHFISKLPPLSDKTFCLCVGCKVRRPKPVVTIAIPLTPENHVMWQVTAISLTVKVLLHPSVLQQLLPPCPSLTFPLFLFLPSIACSTCDTNAIHSVKRGEGRGCRLFLLKAAAPEELNSADKRRERGTTSNRGYKKFIADGKALGVHERVNRAL